MDLHENAQSHGNSYQNNGEENGCIHGGHVQGIQNQINIQVGQDGPASSGDIFNTDVNEMHTQAAEELRGNEHEVGRREDEHSAHEEGEMEHGGNEPDTANSIQDDPFRPRMLRKKQFWICVGILVVVLLVVLPTTSIVESRDKK